MTEDEALARQWLAAGLITADQLSECVEAQANLREVGADRSLEALLRERGYLASEVEAIARVSCRSCGALIVPKPGVELADLLCPRCGEREASAGLGDAPEMTVPLGAEQIARVTAAAQAAEAEREASERTQPFDPAEIERASRRADTPDRQRPGQRTDALRRARGPRRADARQPSRRGQAIETPVAGGRRSRALPAIAASALLLGGLAYGLTRGASPAALGGAGRSGAPTSARSSPPSSTAIASSPASDASASPSPRWRELMTLADGEQDPARAREALDAYLALRPDDDVRRRRRIELGLAAEEGRTLLPHLERLASGEGEARGWAIGKLATTQHRLGMTDRARETLRAADHQQLDDPALLLLTDLLLANDEPGPAIDALQAVTEAGSEPALAALGKLRSQIRSRAQPHLLRGALPVALTQLGERLVALEPGNALYHLLAGDQHMRDRRGEQGIAAFGKAIACESGDFLRGLAHFRRATALMAANRHGPAVSDARQALRKLSGRLLAWPLGTLVRLYVLARDGRRLQLALGAYQNYAGALRYTPNAPLVEGASRLLGELGVGALPADAVARAYPMRIRVLQAVPGSPLQAGDQVVGFEDKLLGDLRVFVQRYQQQSRGGRLQLNVLRGQQQGRLTLETAQLRAAWPQLTDKSQLRLSENIR